MSETAYVSKGRHRRVYHTDEDCTYIHRAERVEERNLDRLEADEDWAECRVCAGDMDWDSTGRGHYQAAVAAGKEGSE